MSRPLRAAADENLCCRCYSTGVVRTFVTITALFFLAAFASAASIGEVKIAGAFGADLAVEFSLRPSVPATTIYFDRRLVGPTVVWRGVPDRSESVRLNPRDAAKIRMLLLRAIHEEVGFATASGWAKSPPDQTKQPREHKLFRLLAEVAPRRPALTETVANDILERGTIAFAVSQLGEPDSTRRPSGDHPAEFLHIWADRLDEYRAVELRFYASADGAIARGLLSNYLIRNPPLTAADVERVRANPTFSQAEDVFGPDSNYVPLARGGAALWETTVDGSPVEISAVVNADSRITRLMVTPLAK